MHPFLGDRLGVCVYNDKSGKNPCLPTSSEGCACSFSCNNDKSSLCLSPPSFTVEGARVAETQGNLCGSGQHCAHQHKIVIERCKYGKIRVRITGTGLLHIPWLARCNNIFCLWLYKAARSHGLCPWQTSAPGALFLAELEEEWVERMCRYGGSLKNRLE